MKPPESFVPLSAAPVPPTPREFRVAILNGHSHGPGGSRGEGGGDGVVRTDSFRSLESPPSSRSLADKPAGEPRVTLQREGDRVTHLRIQCGCGQIMELACVYDQPGTAA